MMPPPYAYSHGSILGVSADPIGHSSSKVDIVKTRHDRRDGCCPDHDRNETGDRMLYPGKKGNGNCQNLNHGVYFAESRRLDFWSTIHQKKDDKSE